MADLDRLAGEWTQEVLVEGVPPGRMVFQWAFNDRYLVQSIEIPKPEFPDSLAIIAPNPDGTYTQHYFDSRGVVRVYRMTLTDREWTLQRTAADFSPLDFFQRFIGTFSADGDTIDGRWEASADGGEHWKVDFPVRLTRAAAPSP